MKMLCVCGLAAEARIARAAGFSVVAGAGDRERTTALVDEAVTQANCLLSFGIAGALAPQLRPGETIISTEVVSEEGSWRPDAAFCRHAATLAGKIGAVEGVIFGAPRILATKAEKSCAFGKTGALAVDLESDVVARAAVAAGIPFLVVRTIADTRYHGLPPAALIPLSAQGRPRLGPVIASLLRRPQQIPELLTLARETRAALSALSVAARALQDLLAGG